MSRGTGVVLAAGLALAALLGLWTHEAPPEPPAPRAEAPISPPGPTVRGDRVTLEVVALGLAWTLEAPADRAADVSAAAETLRAAERTLAPWRAGSEIARLRAAAGATVPASPALRALIDQARAAARLTDGGWSPGSFEVDAEGARAAPGFDLLPILRGRAAEDALAAIGGPLAAVRSAELTTTRGAWPVTIADPRPGGAILAAGPLEGATWALSTAGDCALAVVLGAPPVQAAALARAACAVPSAEARALIARLPGHALLRIDARGDRHATPDWPLAVPAEPDRGPPRATADPPPSRRPAPPRPPAAPAAPALDAVPPDMVRVGAAGDLLLDRHEVSNAAFRGFLDSAAAGAHTTCHPAEPPGLDHTPRYWRDVRSAHFRASPAARVAPFDADTFRQPSHPVVGVDWWSALAYCRWVGRRLPTTAELTRAAQGPGGARWPWGDTWDPARANTGGEKWGEKDGHRYAAPVDAFSAGASPDGALNLAGNVAEWSADGDAVGGSSNSPPSGVAAGARQPRAPGYRTFDLGLRCAADRAPAPVADDAEDT